MKQVVLISGILGSGASYLAEYIVKNHPEVEIHGIARWHSTTNQDNLSNIRKKVNVHECDLLDLASILRIVRKVKPTKVFNLASHANVRVSFDTPLAVLNNNIFSTANLLESMRLESPEAIFQQCSTSEVHGRPLYNPIDENHPLDPCNPYAISKLTQEKLALCYFNSWGIPVITTRAFAYINPRRRDLVASAWAYQVARIEAGKQDVLNIGNIESIRSFIDVRDIAEAYWVASEKCDIGQIYNVGGGQALMVGMLLQILKFKSRVPIVAIEDKKLLRPTDITNQVPDISKFYNKTGWTQKISLDESMDWLLNHMREVVKNEL